MRIIALLTAVLGALALVAAGPAGATPAPAHTVASATQDETTLTGPFRLRNANSNKCLGISGGTMTPGTKAIQWQCSATAQDQEWYQYSSGTTGYYEVYNRKNNTRCLAVPGSATAPGVQLAIYTCSGNPDQRWSFESGPSGTKILRNLNSQLIAAVSGGDYLNGTAVIQWGDSGNVDQRWFRDMCDGHETPRCAP